MTDEGGLARAPVEKVTLADIQKLQGALLNFEPLDLPPKHYFAPGMYGRELWMPAGTLIVSKIHRFAHLSVMVYGDTTVYSERDGKVRYKGYHCMRTEAGTKRALYMHEDTLWITFHCSDKTDLGDLEEELITPDDNEAIAKFSAEFTAKLKEDGLCLGAQ